ncbi:MAG TPA: hypothetical protein VNS09_07920 [Solirubrobacter sp.]|nr:hypothetical protein [Solirubrobacter sp.]
MEPDRGSIALMMFLGAVLLVVIAVVVVGAVDRWWVLAPVMFIDFGATASVLRMIGRLLSDDGDEPDGAND